jgi:hypothetical protein
MSNPNNTSGTQSNEANISTFHTRLNSIVCSMQDLTLPLQKAQLTPFSHRIQTSPPNPSYLSTYPLAHDHETPATRSEMNPSILLDVITDASSSGTWNGKKVKWPKDGLEQIVGGVKAAEDDLLRLDQLPVFVSKDVKEREETA